MINPLAPSDCFWSHRIKKLILTRSIDTTAIQSLVQAHDKTRPIEQFVEKYNALYNVSLYISLHDIRTKKNFMTAIQWMLVVWTQQG